MRTPFGAFLLQERATHTLTVRATDREGAAAFGDVVVQNERTGEAVVVFLDRDQQTVQLPEGDYRVLAQVFGLRPHGPDLLQFVDVTTMAERVRLDQDRAVDLDARRGKPVALGVEEPEARIGDGDSFAEGVGSAIPGVGFALVAVQGGIERHFAVGSGPLPGVSYLVVSAWERPKVTVEMLGPELIELSPYDNSDKGWHGEVTAELVDVGAGTPEDLAGKDLAGKVALFTPDFDVSQDELHQRIAALARSGAVLVLAEPYVDLQQATALPVLQLFSPFDIADLHAALSRDPVRIHARGTASSPYAYHLFDRVRDQVPDGYVFDHRKGSLAAVRVPYHATDGLDHRTGAVSISDDGEYSGFAYTLVQPPNQRTEYYTPGVTWTGLLETSTSTSHVAFIGTPARYRAGEKRRTTWAAAPFEPSLPQYGTDPQDGQPLPWAYRSGDKVRVDLPMLSDSNPDHRGSSLTPPSANRPTAAAPRSPATAARSATATCPAWPASTCPPPMRPACSSPRSRVTTLAGSSRPACGPRGRSGPATSTRTAARRCHCWTPGWRSPSTDATRRRHKRRSPSRWTSGDIRARWAGRYATCVCGPPATTGGGGRR